jgi:hypothetical protein
MDQILEHLRRTAEEFTAEASDSRRPSWAPALLVSEEFLELAREFGGLTGLTLRSVGVKTLRSK